MKFKVGDKVRFVRSTYPFKQEMIGKEYIIQRVIDSYGYSVGEVWLVLDNEIELVKPKFDIKDYPGKYVMHCKTEADAWDFCRYLNCVGRKWTTGRTYIETQNYDPKYTTVYYFNEGLQSSYKHAVEDESEYTILEFEDFDWSDFTMKKEFTKKDLRNGDVVKWSDGDIEIVCVDTGTLISKNGFDKLDQVSDHLVWTGFSEQKDNRIVAVRRPKSPGDCQFIAFDYEFGELVYERKEVEEMTLEEVCKALGKEIKIVKK